MNKLDTRLVLLVSLLALPVAACGEGGMDDPPDAWDCSAETRADPYVAGLEKSSENVVVQLVEATPAPPARGDNVWRIKVMDPSMSAMEGASIMVVPFMPDHGHGTPRTAVVTPMDDGSGEYVLDPVNLWMAGYWETTLTITPSGGTADDAEQVVYKFCIEG